MVDGIFLAAAILLGACLGSFLNVVIYRVPRGTFFSKGSRSRCPHCNVAIPGYHNLPVLSWVLLLGRARCCGNRISVRYPIVEAVTAGLVMALFLDVVYPLSPVADGPTTREWLQFAFQTWFLATLVACTFIDIDHRLLPDVLTKPAMAIGLIGALLVPGLACRLNLQGLDVHVDSLMCSGLGLATGYGLTWLVRWTAGKLFRQEAMGFGDVKLMGAIGAFVGWDGALLAFFLGCVLGSVYGAFHKWITGEAEVFFGPFLAGGAVITLFFREQLLVFFTKTWPQWQQQLQLSPWVLALVTIVCVFLLVVLVKRGRAR